MFDGKDAPYAEDAPPHRSICLISAARAKSIARLIDHYIIRRSGVYADPRRFVYETLHTIRQGREKRMVSDEIERRPVFRTGSSANRHDP